jgi:hypothetical protein
VGVRLPPLAPHSDLRIFVLDPSSESGRDGHLANACSHMDSGAIRPPLLGGAGDAEVPKLTECKRTCGQSDGPSTRPAAAFEARLSFRCVIP